MLTLSEVLADFASFIGLGGHSEVGVATRGPRGESPLHWMATLGDVNAIRLLVRSGAQVSAADCQGNTPLHEAVASRQAPAAEALIALGANVNVRNAIGQTPQDVANCDGHAPAIALFARL